MKTNNRLRLLWNCGVVTIAVAFSASAFAGKEAPGQQPQNVVQKASLKPCYAPLPGSHIPQPCERIGPVLTTAIPVVVIGQYNVGYRFNPETGSSKTVKSGEG